MSPARPRIAEPSVADPRAARLLAPLARLLGRRGAPDLCAAVAVLDGVGARGLARASAPELRAAAGLAPAAAERLRAAVALGRALERLRRPPGVELRSADRVHALLAPEIRGLEREQFHALLLDAKHRLLARERVSEGTLSSSLVHPREVFTAAVRAAAAAIIVAHNHPSGDPEPSAEDLTVTRRLVDVGRLLGIPLLDHVVLAEDRYVSLRDRIAFDAR